MTVDVEKAAAGDLAEILALFDAAQAWLVESGHAGQWGTVPFSRQPRQVERFGAWIEEGTFHVARANREIVGTLVLSDTPPSYVEDVSRGLPRRHLYVEALASRRDASGRGVGRMLLAWAEGEAGRRGVPWLRLDCWADNPGLRTFYRSAGYTETAEFRVGEWRGMLFEKRVAGTGGGAA